MADRALRSRPSGAGQATTLAALEASFEQEASLDQSFVVLTVAASLIATLGLLADSAAVVIGAMLIAPWILPLRSASFAILDGQLRLVGRALLTLAVGVAITVLTSAALGLVAHLPVLGDEVLGRTTPNLLDLGIALVAGSVATYGRLKPEAVSSVAGTAIAVALVPPVCVLGLLLALQEWDPPRVRLCCLPRTCLASCPGLPTLVATQASLRQPLFRSQMELVSLLLTGLLIPLTGGFVTLLGQAQQRQALRWSGRLPRACVNARSPWGGIRSSPTSRSIGPRTRP